jgi:hypothetical protein
VDNFVGDEIAAARTRQPPVLEMTLRRQPLRGVRPHDVIARDVIAEQVLRSVLRDFSRRVVGRVADGKRIKRLISLQIACADRGCEPRRRWRGVAMDGR